MSLVLVGASVQDHQFWCWRRRVRRVSGFARMTRMAEWYGISDVAGPSSRVSPRTWERKCRGSSDLAGKNSAERKEKSVAVSSPRSGWGLARIAREPRLVL
jgi:hypothetical protein